MKKILVMLVNMHITKWSKLHTTGTVNRMCAMYYKHYKFTKKNSFSCLNVSVWVSASLAQFGVNATSQVLLLVTKGAAPQREGDQVDLLRINQLQAQAQIQRQSKTITFEVAVFRILSVPICAILILLMAVARPVWAEIMCFSCSANWFWSGQMWEGSWSPLIARNHLLGVLGHR